MPVLWILVISQFIKSLLKIWLVFGCWLPNLLLVAILWLPSRQFVLPFLNVVPQRFCKIKWLEILEMLFFLPPAPQFAATEWCEVVQNCGLQVEYTASLWYPPKYVQSRWGASFFAHVQTGPGAHPASCTVGTGSFPGGKAARAWCWPPTPS
jgi:hypothetical protein